MESMCDGRTTCDCVRTEEGPIPSRKLNVDRDHQLRLGTSEIEGDRLPEFSLFLLA